MDYGALIIRERLGEEAVIKDSAAEKAGLQEFDIILEAGNEKINEKNPLANIIQNFEIGDTIDFKILRKGKEIVLKVKLEERK